MRTIPGFLCIFLFLDALDEYSGKPVEIVEFLNHLNKSRPGTKTKFKVCFSSRPLQLFLDEFDAGNCRVPGFDIKDYTKGDIELFISNYSSIIYNSFTKVSRNSSKDTKMIAMELCSILVTSTVTSISKNLS